MPIPTTVASLSAAVMQAEREVNSARTGPGRKKAREKLEAAQQQYRRAFRQAKKEGLAN